MKKSSLLANFLISLQKGGVEIDCENRPAINFSSTPNTKTVDILEIPVKVSKKPGFIKQLSEAKNLAKRLKEEKITLEVKHEGDLVLRLGEKANPKLARIVTLSKDIEISDLKKLNSLQKIL